MTPTVEQTILENLLHSEEYFRLAIPHLKEEYFDNRPEKMVLKFISKFAEAHNKAPSPRILSMIAKEYKGFSQEEFVECQSLINSLSGKEENVDWLLERTEKFCRDKAIYNSIISAITIIDANKGEEDTIPHILQEALAISFDKSVGHDFYDDAESRYEYYHRKEDRIPFRLDMFNKITKGGIPRKTLNCALAGINVGKSLFLCDYAASALSQGWNVLYITLEMAEEKIAERIDCNLLDIYIDDLYRIKRDDFISGIKGIESRSHGQLIIKEYPTGGAHVGHFRSLIDELKTKKGFVPDVICIDYINICASQKYKSTNYSSYFAIKAIAEELRGLMVECNAVGFTATQVTRGGYKNGDVDMTDTSESFGLPATLDFMFAIERNEEYDARGQLKIKQLKSRYNDPNYYKNFLVGIEIKKFKLYNVEMTAQDTLNDLGVTDKDVPLFDASKSGSFAEIDFN